MDQERGKPKGQNQEFSLSLSYYPTPQTGEDGILGPLNWPLQTSALLVGEDFNLLRGAKQIVAAHPFGPQQH